MFDTTINKIVDHWIDNNVINSDDKDNYTYGLDLVFSSAANITLVMATALVTGRVLESIGLLAVIIPLQSCSGGYHAKTHLRCFLIMYIGWWCVVPLIPYINLTLGINIAILSLIILLVFAPVPHVNVTMSEKHFDKMKKVTKWVAFISAITGIGLSCLSGKVGMFGTSVITGMGVVALSVGVARVLYWLEGGGVR